jgi:hypothetical protein
MVNEMKTESNDTTILNDLVAIVTLQRELKIIKDEADKLKHILRQEMTYYVWN